MVSIGAAVKEPGSTVKTKQVAGEHLNRFLTKKNALIAKIVSYFVLKDV